MASIRAGRMAEAKPSFIRESLKLAADPSIISFAGGNPDAEYFPAQELISASRMALQNDWRSALQYSITEGYVGLREILRGRMAKAGIDAKLDELVITSGSQQGLDLTAKIFIDPGDIVLVESPTYMGAVNAFKFYQPRFVEVEMDEDGMLMDDLEQKLRENPTAKYIYTIPDFQNPTGRVLARERRVQMVELAQRYEVLIVEDNPYYDLRFSGEAIPPIKHFDRYGKVIYLGSMSKILCPAMRIGWIVASPEIIKDYVVLKQACDLCTNELAQRIVAQYLLSEDIDAHIALVNAEYKKKKGAMMQAYQELFPQSIKATNPQGGLFIWMTLPEGYDTLEIFNQALATEKVIFVPGDTFYPYGGHANTLRMCYATTSVENIAVGMERLAKVFKQVFSS